MKYTIETSIDINEPIEKVWSIFKDFDNHDKWNKTLKIHGTHLELNTSFKVDFMKNGEVGMSFKPKLLRDDHEQGFEWLGHLFIPGLFDGHHIFHFTKIDDHNTRFVQAENFSGLLVRPMLKSVIIPTIDNFNQFNSDFKRFVEQNVR